MACRHRLLAITVMLLLILPLTGCWNRRELNTMGIVGLIGVDASDTGVKSTTEIIKPEKSSKDGGQKTELPVKYIQADGQTIMDTYRDSALRFDRKLFLSHTKELLFSEQLAKNGLAVHLDQILRDHEMRLTMHLVIVKDTSAADVMGFTSGINTIPSGYIEDLIKQYKAHSRSVDSTVLNFLRAYTAQGINPVVTVIKKVKKTKIGTEKGDEFELSVEGAAVFLKDRLVGFLDGPETRGYNWVIGKVISGIVSFPTPDSDEGITSVEVLNAESKNDVEITDDNIKIKVKINMNGMIDEQTSKLDLTDPRVTEILEQATSQTINKEVEHTLQKVQKEYRSDIFGFGQIVHRKYPQECKSMQIIRQSIYPDWRIETITVRSRYGKDSAIVLFAVAIFFLDWSSILS